MPEPVSPRSSDGEQARLRVAIVVPDYRSGSAPHGGGLGTVAEFVRSALTSSGRYSAEIVSVATSRVDTASRRLVDPRSWVRRSLSEQRDNGDLAFRHFGANGVELEPLRYWPRRELTDYLNTFDLVQVVAGSPALGTLVKRIRRPVCLQVATMIKWERAHHSRDAGPKGWARRLATRCVRVMDERALALPECIFVENAQMLAEVRRLGYEARLAPPGVDTDFFRPGAGEGVDANPYLLSVGRLDDPRKNVALLLRAYRRLLDLVPDAPRLVLAGQTAPQPAQLDLLSELGIQHRVEVRVGLSDTELRDAYQGATAFLLASHEEGLGLVVVEAIACGVPVIATRTAGTEAILSETGAGVLVEQGEGAEAALAEGVRQLLERPSSRAQMGARARQVAVARYSLDATRRAFLQAYDELTA